MAIRQVTSIINGLVTKVPDTDTIQPGFGLTFSSTVTPQITQADKTTNGGTGATFTIQAQHETGTTSIGGKLVLQSGSGTSSNGIIEFKSGTTTLGNMFLNGGTDWRFALDSGLTDILFQANGTNQFIVFQAIGSGCATYFQSPVYLFMDGTPAEAFRFIPVYNGSSEIDVASTVTDFTLKHTSKASSSGGDSTYIAQSSTFVGGNGGNLLLKAGSNTTTAGGGGTVFVDGGSSGTNVPAGLVTLRSSTSQLTVKQVHGTGPVTAFALTYTTNLSSGDDWGIKVTQTDTSSPGTSMMAEFLVSSASKWSLDNTGKIIQTKLSIGESLTSGYHLKNTTAATDVVQQWSPAIQLTGQGWSTDALASHAVDWAIQNRPAAGGIDPGTEPSTVLAFLYQINNGGFVSGMELSSAGYLGVGTYDETTQITIYPGPDDSYILFGKNTANCVMGQLDTAVDTGANLLLTAQNATVTGGTLRLKGGEGTTRGSVSIESGNRTVVTLTATDSVNADMTFAANLTGSISILQAQSASGAGAQMNIRAQQGQTATVNVGGTLVLGGGDNGTLGSGVAGNTLVYLGQETASFDTASFIINYQNSDTDGFNLVEILRNNAFTEVNFSDSGVYFTFPDQGSVYFYNDGSGGNIMFGVSEAGGEVILGEAQVSFSANARLGNVVISHEVRSGTGANNGHNFNIDAQRGQNQTGGSANNNGGALILCGGDAGTGGGGAAGLIGPVQISLGTSLPIVSMIETAQLSTTRRVVSLCRAAAITSTELPTSSGDLIVYIGNAATAPTADPVSGGILYSEGGALKWRGTTGTVTTIAGA